MYLAALILGQVCLQFTVDFAAEYFSLQKGCKVSLQFTDEFTAKDSCSAFIGSQVSLRFTDEFAAENGCSLDPKSGLDSRLNLRPKMSIFHCRKDAKFVFNSRANS